MRFPRLALAIFGPAIIAVGLIFFYALPRIGNAQRLGSSGLNSVGFSEQFHLGQIGQMLRNSELAMRVTLNQPNSSRAYLVEDSIYLRGLVFEIYEPGDQFDGKISKWGSLSVDSTLGVKAIPPEYLPSDSADEERFDLIDVRVMTEPMRSKSLFMIAPYHRTGPSAGLVHAVSSWTSYRSDIESGSFPRMDYTFGSAAFSRGQQTRLLTPLSHPTESLVQSYEQNAVDPGMQEINERLRIDELKTLYRRATLAIDRDDQPTAASMAERIAKEVPANERSPYGIAMAFENYFQQSGEFSYTLYLDAEPIPGMDSVEQFLAVDKKGHCQYFASGLVMMLRSQGIPARIVAGYNTDEFNELGGYYMVRQLHAHAWVEALVPRESIPKALLNSEGYVPGQLPADEYWLRLDPTPAAGRENRDPASGMDQVMDLAKNMWDEYVVDMDGNRQDNSLIGGKGRTSMSDSYSSFISNLQLQISRIRNAEFGGGAWAGRDVFSIPAALLVVGLALATVVLFRLRLPSWLRSRARRKGSNVVAEPSIPFYAEALRQLGRLGLYRDAGQTPAEFANDQTSNPQYAMFTEPLSTLTTAFYRCRYGRDAATQTSETLEPEVELALSDVREKVARIRGQKA
jgi:protein-glutamine gamma-glutamyltransferase